jgi:secreted trypsin-like serine protease
VRSLPRIRSRQGTIGAVFLLAGAITLVGLLLAQATPDAKPTPPVIGGVPAGQSLSSSLAIVLDRQSAAGVGECTGTVVAPRLVLTAGHCVLRATTQNPSPASGFGVFIASFRPTQPPLRVSRVVLYPGFQNAPLGHADAALLVLSHPTSASPLLLAPARSPLGLNQGQGATIVGWSRNLGQRPDSPFRSVQAKTELLSSAACSKAAKERNGSLFHPRYQLCAGAPRDLKTGICHGDSGGPLVVRAGDGRAVEIGMADSTAPSCSTRDPDVYVRVSTISPWVEEWAERIRQ